MPLFWQWGNLSEPPTTMIRRLDFLPWEAIFLEQFVLVIDDNEYMLEKSRSEWEKHYVGLSTVKNVWAAIEELPRKNYVLLVIVDEFVNSSLLDTIRVIRSFSSLPIQVLCSTYIPEIKIASLSLGADEFIVATETIEENVASGVALIRRYTTLGNGAPSVPHILGDKELKIWVEYRKIFVYDQEIDLTRKEFDILQLLMEHKKMVMTYEQIFMLVWKEEFEDQIRKTLSNHVCSLRQKLKVRPDQADYIKNVHSVGYKFDPD
jgi:DNA-binding response OmpR family regulator